MSFNSAGPPKSQGATKSAQPQVPCGNVRVLSNLGRFIGGTAPSSVRGVRLFWSANFEIENLEVVLRVVGAHRDHGAQQIQKPALSG